MQTVSQQAIELDLVGEGGRQNVVSDARSRLEEKRKFSQYERDEEIKKTLHSVFKTFIYVASGVLLIVFVIRIAHLVIPEHFSWLTAEQVQGMDKIFFSSAIGGFIANYFNKYKNVE